MKSLAKLENYNPVADLEIVMTNEVTARHILESQKPNVITFQKVNGIEKTNKVIEYMITQSMRIVGVNALNEVQLKLLSNELRSYCRYYTLADIAIVLKNGCMGRYGQFYGRVGIDTILGKDGWFQQYEEERAIELEKIKNNLKHKVSETRQNEMSFDEWKKNFPEKYNQRLDKIKQIGAERKKEKVTHYLSIKQYCQANEIEFESYAENLKSEWEQDFLAEKPKLTKDQYLALRERIYLIELNQNKNG